MCSATFLNCQSYQGSIDISSGHPGAPSFLLRARLGKEEFGQTNFDANVLPEPACRLEIVKHVTGYGKILSERDLKLESSYFSRLCPGSLWLGLEGSRGGIQARDRVETQLVDHTSVGPWPT